VPGTRAATAETAGDACDAAANTSDAYAIGGGTRDSAIGVRRTLAPSSTATQAEASLPPLLALPPAVLYSQERERACSSSRVRRCLSAKAAPSAGAATARPPVEETGGDASAGRDTALVVRRLSGLDASHATPHSWWLPAAGAAAVKRVTDIGAAPAASLVRESPGWASEVVMEEEEEYTSSRFSCHA
jgi:hypothetical protein